MKRRIAILHHEKHPDIDAYVISLFAAQWRNDGHEVLHVSGTRHFVPADIVIVHVDLSVVPQHYLDYAARYPIALNGRLRDIRKSAFAVPELTRIDDWDGPVIVKSDPALHPEQHPQRSQEHLSGRQHPWPGLDRHHAAGQRRPHGGAGDAGGRPGADPQGRRRRGIAGRPREGNR